MTDANFSSYPHKKRICFDFDGTLVKWGEMNGPFVPNDDMVELARKVYDMGFEVVIFTSRMSPTWWQESGVDPTQQQEMLEETLEELGIPYHYITSEKVPAAWYIDDRAIEFRGDASTVAAQLFSKGLTYGFIASWGMGKRWHLVRNVKSREKTAYSDAIATGDIACAAQDYSRTKSLRQVVTTAIPPQPLCGHCARIVKKENKS